MSMYMEFERGNALIVGKRVEGVKDEFKIDGILIYDAYCLSSEIPYLLQVSGASFKETEPIYICGHGNKKEQTISGYTMEEIAQMLYGNYNYVGTQEIVIMSCYAASENGHGETMASLLCRALKDILNDDKIKVKAICKHTSIVVNFFERALVKDRYNTDDKKKILEDYFHEKQYYFENNIGCGELCLTLRDKNDFQTYHTVLHENWKQDYIKLIAGWNYKMFFKGTEVDKFYFGEIVKNNPYLGGLMRKKKNTGGE